MTASAEPGPTAAAAPAAPAWLTIQPAGWRLPVAAGQTLLQAALAHGVRLPSSCRNGSCRSCICQLQHGQVAYTIAWPGLLAEEKREGWLLPCVAIAAAGDLTINAPAAVRLPRPAAD
jgi:ferredoxin